jgi:3D-(3,5/4)-trihydroxycyclohexane-1,2-dione acylhydrolase (decyclizing)
VETFAGKGAVLEDAWFGLGGLGLEGNPGANEIARDADLVIAVGTRLTDFATGSNSLFRNPDVRFVAVNVDGRDARKAGALPVVADAREALVALNDWAVGRRVEPYPGYREQIDAARSEWRAQREALANHITGELMSQGELILAMNEAAQPGDTILTAAGTPPGDLLKIWDATGGRDCHIEFGFSCMGYELPAAVGVKLARPEHEVIAYVGDGTYLLNPGELVTALQHDVKITVVISENHGFQSIRRLQMGRVGRHFGNEFRHRDGSGRLDGAVVELDLARSAEGLGARAWRATTADEVRTALAEAREETSRPCVIVCETEPHRYLPDAGVWWDVAPAEVSHVPEVQDRRFEYEQDRAEVQRFLY